MWQLVFALCHAFFNIKFVYFGERTTRTTREKGRLMVTADPSDLGHGKK